MPTTYTTIAITSQPHARHSVPTPRAPLGTEQRKALKEQRDTKQEHMDTRINKWFSDTMALAEEMAVEFKLKPKYFLDIFFQGGARMVRHQNNINSYNTFKLEKAAECRERGESKRAPELHREYFEEYSQLTDAEKDEYVERFKEVRQREIKLRRDTPRGKIQDVANIVRNIKLLMCGLSTRVGVEGFFCIVRNTSDYHMAPQWYFTSRELEQYMPIATRKKWATAEVGTKIEAFAVAGCEVLSASPCFY
ncbi:hypothetical protein C8J57DRAFT_1041559 [Mycena rebaudengoi]|nr:hypothetical protein C8J57DRAFT_1041559 [Mycena rebaudengoi]